jgi:hypothetical protein
MIRCIGRGSWVALLVLTLSVWVEGSAPKPPTLPGHAAQVSLPPPFQLTADEQKDVDHLLDRWQRWNSQLQTFDCRFTRWTYDVVFGPPNQAKFIDVGVIKYTAPDRVMHCVETTEKDGRAADVDPARADHWISDGRSIFAFDASKKQLRECQLPPELQGTRLVDGPLSFGFPSALVGHLFGGPAQGPVPLSAKADSLRQQYYLRRVAAKKRQDEVWLEAYPRTAQQARWVQKIQLIFNDGDMSPLALQIVQPNNKDYVVYQFFDVVINDPLRILKDDPFRAYTPPGWQRIVEQPPRSQQVSRPVN